MAASGFPVFHHFSPVFSIFTIFPHFSTFSPFPVSGFRFFLIFPAFFHFSPIFSHFSSFFHIFLYFRFRFPVSGFRVRLGVPCCRSLPSRLPVSGFSSFSPFFLNFSTFFLIFPHCSSFFHIFPHFLHFSSCFTIFVYFSPFFTIFPHFSHPFFFFKLFFSISASGFRFSVSGLDLAKSSLRVITRIFLLQRYEERIKLLSQENKVSKFCMDAGFIHVVEVGQYFMTKDTGDFRQFRSVATQKFLQIHMKNKRHNRV